MSAKDIFHDAVKSALQKDGWKVADKQLQVTWENIDLYIDLAAENCCLRIVEVKRLR